MKNHREFMPLPLLPGSGVVPGHGVFGTRAITRGTMLDAKFAGETLVVEFGHLVPHPDRVGKETGKPGSIMLAKGCQSISALQIPPGMRTGLRKDEQGCINVPPVLACVNTIHRLVLEIEATNKKGEKIGKCNDDQLEGLVKAVRGFGRAFDSEARRKLQYRVGRVRAGVGKKALPSFNLVTVPGFSSKIFEYGRFKKGDWSSLMPWEVGVPSRVMDRLNNGKRRELAKTGDDAGLSRWPTFDAHAAEIREVGGEWEGRQFCLYVSPHEFRVADGEHDTGAAVLNYMKRIEGDCDGDAENGVVCQDEESRSDLLFNKIAFKTKCNIVYKTDRALGWDDHVDYELDRRASTMDSCEEKTWVPALSLDTYALLMGMAWEEKMGLDHGLGYYDVKHAMKVAAEHVFDKKNNLAYGDGEVKCLADPRPLHGFLVQMEGYGWQQVEENLKAQELDVDTFRRISDFLSGTSCRTLAKRSPAWDLMHGRAWMSTLVDLFKNCPEEKTVARRFNEMLFPNLNLDL